MLHSNCIQAPGVMKTNFYMFPTENVYIDIFFVVVVQRSTWNEPSDRIHETKLRIQSGMY